MVLAQDACLTDGEQSGNEDPDITDEHAQLLHSGIILKPHKTIGTFPPTIALSPYLSQKKKNRTFYFLTFLHDRNRFYILCTKKSHPLMEVILNL